MIDAERVRPAARALQQLFILARHYAISHPRAAQTLADDGEYLAGLIAQPKECTRNFMEYLESMAARDRSRWVSIANGAAEHVEESVRGVLADYAAGKTWS